MGRQRKNSIQDHDGSFPVGGFKDEESADQRLCHKEVQHSLQASFQGWQRAFELDKDAECSKKSATKSLPLALEILALAGMFLRCELARHLAHDCVIPDISDSLSQHMSLPKETIARS